LLLLVLLLLILNLILTLPLPIRRRCFCLPLHARLHGLLREGYSSPQRSGVCRKRERAVTGGTGTGTVTTRTGLASIAIAIVVVIAIAVDTVRRGGREWRETLCGRRRTTRSSNGLSGVERLSADRW
jgi:hypothetical protein